ncbi:MAG: DEAD/DEAH box helicase family protein [Corynebacterium casei]|uniref:DEAD/DEAH box helicase family protein n=1 Tax=Corynebacterium casei TaxID=160386 RepID=UPI002647A2C8|nr:DEAD/DEAH box helicase family protein [Corynebacterium casei]MDN6629399.1 DEAD/DEAH box helicase family protein [Corynebacterium casei]MDN6694803.1 DEAD/DEAH box helicase family protein [Corynebacterium casei]
MSQFLFHKLEALEEIGALTPMPMHITENLGNHVVLRDYQRRGLEYFLTYLDQDGLRKNKQVHTLFHMATGSGKTVMMASLILHLYTLGYRRFIFFVNQTTILEKTKANFLDQASNKHLFSDSITIDGESVPVNQVSNFARTNSDAINICFVSTSKLHLDLMYPTENGLSIDDFGDEKVVLLSDEAHHVNTLTKATKGEELAIKSWEYSVTRAFRENSDNMLLEFTATANLNDPNIRAKYLDKIVFDYPLAKFRESGFTKEFRNFRADLPAWERSLIALVLSEYRRSLATQIRQNIKPVVLLKSSRVSDSEDFYVEFFRKLADLTPDQILRLDSGEEVYHEAIKHFRARDMSLQQLVAALQLGFSEDKALMVNNKNQAEKIENQLALNSLEDASNPYRLIFAVDMLNEGWDVLNLFDIVRVYETRKSKNYTVKEAQLIGRAARYCPFVEDEEQERSVRKYDGDLTNPYRLLETMFFHSVDDSKYITELLQALKENGLLDPETYTVTYRVKDEFKQSQFWHEGLVFSNKKVEKPREATAHLPNRYRAGKATVKAENISFSVVDLFSEAKVPTSTTATEIHSRRFQDLPYNVLLGTVDESPALRFNILKSKFPQLSSLKEFLTSSNYMGEVTVDVVTPTSGTPTAQDWQRGIRQAIADVATYILRTDRQYEGSTTFEAAPIRTVLRDKTLNLSKKDIDGVGTSQKDVTDANLQLDLTNKDWYVFNDNYGTSEEKHFVRHLSSMMDDLRSKYDEVYLVRNERFAQLAIYDFHTGERFEPDFLLFLRDKSGNAFSQEQVYVEPKGSHLLEQDRWKERFLLSLQDNAVPSKVYVDSIDYRIVGLPLFTQGDINQMKLFTASLAETISSAIPIAQFPVKAYRSANKYFDKLDGASEVD